MGRTNLTRFDLLFELVYSAHFFTHTSLKCTLLGMVRRRQKDRINILLLSARNFEEDDSDVVSGKFSTHV